MLNVTDASGQITAEFIEVIRANRPTDISEGARITDFGGLWIDIIREFFNQRGAAPLKSYYYTKPVIINFLDNIAYTFNTILDQLSLTIRNPTMSVTIPEDEGVRATYVIAGQLKQKLAEDIIPYAQRISEYIGRSCIQRGASSLDFQAIRNLALALHHASTVTARRITAHEFLQLTNFLIFGLTTNFKPTMPETAAIETSDAGSNSSEELEILVGHIITARDSFLKATKPDSVETPEAFYVRTEIFYGQMAHILNLYCRDRASAAFNYAHAIAIINNFNILFNDSLISGLAVLDKHNWTFDILPKLLQLIKDATSIEEAFSTITKSLQLLFIILNNKTTPEKDIILVSSKIPALFEQLGSETTNAILDSLILFCSKPQHRVPFEDRAGLYSLSTSSTELAAEGTTDDISARHKFCLNILDQLHKIATKKRARSSSYAYAFSFSSSHKLLIRKLTETIVAHHLALRRPAVISTSTSASAGIAPSSSAAPAKSTTKTPEDASLALIESAMALNDDAKIDRFIDFLLYDTGTTNSLRRILEDEHHHFRATKKLEKPTMLDVYMRKASALSIATMKNNAPRTYDSPAASAGAGSTDGFGLELRVRRPSTAASPKNTLDVNAMIFAIQVLKLIPPQSIDLFLMQLKTSNPDQYILFLEAYCYQQREFFLRLPIRSAKYEWIFPSIDSSTPVSPYLYGRRLDKFLDELSSTPISKMSETLRCVFAHCEANPPINSELEKRYGADVAKFQYLMSVFAKIFLPETLVTKGLISQAEYEFYQSLCNHFNELLLPESRNPIEREYARTSATKKNLLAVLAAAPEIWTKLITFINLLTGKSLPIDAIIAAANIKKIDAREAAEPILAANPLEDEAESSLLAPVAVAPTQSPTPDKQLLPSTNTNTLVFTLALPDSFQTDSFTIQKLDPTGLTNRLAPTHGILEIFFDLCALNTASLPTPLELITTLTQKLRPALMGIDMANDSDIFTYAEAYLNYLIAHPSACIEWYGEYAAEKRLPFGTTYDGARLISTLGEIRKDLRAQAQKLKICSARGALAASYYIAKFGIPAVFITFLALFIDRLIVNPDENNPYSRDTLYANYASTFFAGAAVLYFLFTPDLRHAIFERLRPSQERPPSWLPFILLTAIPVTIALISWGGYAACQWIADAIVQDPAASPADQAKLLDVIIAGVSLFLTALFSTGASASAIASLSVVLSGTRTVRQLAARADMPGLDALPPDAPLVVAIPDRPDPFAAMAAKLNKTPSPASSPVARAGAGAAADSTSLWMAAHGKRESTTDDNSSAADGRTAVTASPASSALASWTALPDVGAGAAGARVR